MLATPERVVGTDRLIWHKPVGRIMEEFQAITCSDEDGIVMPGPRRNVPLGLDEPGERWCEKCLARIRSGRSA